MPTTTPLYKGSNDVQDFWQSEDGKGLLLKVHGEIFWTVFVDLLVVTRPFEGGYVTLGSSIVSQALEILNENSVVQYHLDESKVWVDNKAGQGKMILTDNNDKVA